ncbi:hypothetical protein CEP88_10295 [Roseobacter denitrificans]|uniref:Uncharacterized protein n=1 Tax=Roseobacter denitrificans (strain ATCC 33942 / OCh 114) TaxID=375451 RepID=Q160D1_ROSDO|nr:hypothetical protein [Roseobacter denitrificans]ABG33662.1 hypothetical protein RD1_4225 [Roseobacter denitrificans OCh 114]AVL52952.1 hypothetical protein CEP88_10295 [Roseobacter denitrificans]SFG03001.1 hypothetical protein SAMN05443635_10615 [Roseobacter denitrificans OCh 114]
MINAPPISLMRMGAAIALALIGLAGCGFIADRLRDEPVKRVEVLTPDQACDASEQTQNRLSGGYLRQAEAGGLAFDPVLVNGRSNSNGLSEEIDLNDKSQTRETQDIRGTTFIGTKKASAKLRAGFGQPGKLPNVYDVTYAINDINFTGPMVIGPAAVISEIPTSGATLYAGKVALSIIAPNNAGELETTKATGRFEMNAGYASQRGSFTAKDFDKELSFDRLIWRNLFLCGTRFVSSGKGVVGVQEGDGPVLAPFKTDREPAPFGALFESSQFAPSERPAPPVSFGGVLVIQSDNGTIIAAFLSDQVKEQESDV